MSLALLRQIESFDLEAGVLGREIDVPATKFSKLSLEANDRVFEHNIVVHNGCEFVLLLLKLLDISCLSFELDTVPFEYDWIMLNDSLKLFYASLNCPDSCNLLAQLRNLGGQSSTISLCLDNQQSARRLEFVIEVRLIIGL